VRMASTSVAGALISPLASLAGRVARGQPHEMFPDRLRRTSPGEPASDPGLPRRRRAGPETSRLSY